MAANGEIAQWVFVGLGFRAGRLVMKNRQAREALPYENHLFETASSKIVLVHQKTSKLRL